MKKILSIDGGGIRGLIPALVLAELEKKTGKGTAESYDLIAGTSTGGILALGLSTDDGNGKPRNAAKELAALYEEHGNKIFSRSLWQGISSVWGLGDELYSHQGLEDVLQEYFSDDPLGAGLTNVLVTSYDIRNRKPVFMKSWKEEYRSVLMKHAARATSAAPTYFEPALVQIGSETRALVDGGVFINSPCVSAYAEGKKLFPDEQDFFVLSLGTGELIRPIPYSEAKDWGKVRWLSPLVSCMFDGMADAATYQMKMFLGEKYIRLQTTLTTASDDLDDATNGNIQNLKMEAQKLLRARKPDIERICNLLSN